MSIVRSARNALVSPRIRSTAVQGLALTAILFGQNKVRGPARLVDVQTGQVGGEYVIGRTVTGSRVGVIQMAEAEEQLSDGFGAEICRQAFSVEPPPVAH